MKINESMKMREEEKEERNKKGKNGKVKWKKRKLLIDKINWNYKLPREKIEKTRRDKKIEKQRKN